MSALPKRTKKLAGLKKAPLQPRGTGRGGGLLGSLAGSVSLPTLWPALDSAQIGFRGGELSLVMGRSAHGKSNFLLNLLLSWLQQAADRRFLFYSLEMTPQQCAARLLSMLGARRAGLSLNAAQALRGLRGEASAPGLPACVTELRGLEERIHFVYEPLWDVDRLASDVSLQKAEGIAAIFVDPLSSLAVPPERARSDRRDLELSHVSRRLKELAVRLNCPVIGSVPTRSMRYEEGEGMRALIGQGRELKDLEIEDAIRLRRPRLSHLPEGTLEQEADVVLGLLSYLADFQQELEPDHRLLFQSRTKGLLEVSALKNRQGPLEAAELEMDSKTSLIIDNPEVKSL